MIFDNSKYLADYLINSLMGIDRRINKESNFP